MLVDRLCREETVDPLAHSPSPYRGRAPVRAVGTAAVPPRLKPAPNRAVRARVRRGLFLIAWLAMLAVLLLSGPGS